MQYTIQRRYSWFKPATVEIGAEFEALPERVKLGAAAKVAFKSGADLSGAVLRGADLRGVDLSGAVLSGADLSDADLSGAVLRGAVLSGAVLRGADLSGAVLRDADLSGAVLSGADLSGAVLRGADLRGVDLSGAVLSGAVLRDADLSDADLSGADLSGVKDLPDFTMPDGLKFSEYLRDVVPALLTAGGKTIEEIVATGAWDCHSWDNCPMHAAFGISASEDGPPLLRARIAEFVQYFDAGHIPNPLASKDR